MIIRYVIPLIIDSIISIINGNTNALLATNLETGHILSSLTSKLSLLIKLLKNIGKVLMHSP
jgi:hypothetical protein